MAEGVLKPEIGYSLMGADDAGALCVLVWFQGREGK
jgi:hypothetical protein